ncbi:MAG: primosomal protein N' [Puniceicoccaceae bacterium]|nr:MAG: primosomal protein N' [Puniceicoccaceae bacterium]
MAEDASIEKVAAVRLLTGLDRPLHYRIPKAWSDSLETGHLVRIPLRNRHPLGVVLEVDVVPEVPRDKLRLITEVLYPRPVLTADLLQLTDWMSRYYGSRWETILETMIPAPARKGMRPKTSLTLHLARPVSDAELAALAQRAPKQAKLLSFLRDQPLPPTKSDVLKRLGIASTTCESLIKKGLLAQGCLAAERVAYADDLGASEQVGEIPPELTTEQKAAVEALSNQFDTGDFVCTLLQGVTGSGKTEVYLHLMQRALEAGGGIIFLVPEVALTPQTIGRLRARLARLPGVKAVVWHSHLSDGERLDAWLALARGEARVVVGARSAIFAPLKNLRLIIVDEEHEPAYKQEESPRYQGRDVAVYRARLVGGLCILGSATPSLETVRNALTGRYQRLQLTQRIDNRRMPTMQLVDMRGEVLSRRGPVTLSRILEDKLKARYSAREQAILFINRRGFAPHLLCRDCGHVEGCTDCSITLTYHRTDETLKCHLCGAMRPAPKRCPACGSIKIQMQGHGTQRVEAVVQRILPTAKIVRIDADTMARRHQFRQILTAFRQGRIDVLIGTQMIAKGLDFPNVTLVGLVEADLSLHQPDFRSAERTFQLLVQVAGRAGRGDRAGEVIVQTYTPHAGPIQFARRNDVDGFLQAELETREAFGYPPFRHLVQHLFRGPNPEKLAFVAEQWVRRIEGKTGPSVEIRGPAPCATEKIKGHYRFQVWYFTNQVSRLVTLLKREQEDFLVPEDVIQAIDVDPASPG